MPLERKALKALRRQLKSDWRNAIGVKLSVGRDAPLADEPAMIRLLGREIDHILPEIFPAAAGAAFTPDSVRVSLGMLLRFTNFRVFDRISCQVLAWRDGDRILSCRFSNNNGPGSLVFNMHTHKQKPQNMICYAYNLTGSGTYQPDVTTALDIAQGLVPETRHKRFMAALGDMLLASPKTLYPEMPCRIEQTILAAFETVPGAFAPRRSTFSYMAGIPPYMRFDGHLSREDALREQGFEVISILSRCLHDCLEVDVALMLNLGSPEESFSYCHIPAVFGKYAHAFSVACMLSAADGSGALAVWVGLEDACMVGILDGESLVPKPASAFRIKARLLEPWGIHADPKNFWDCEDAVFPVAEAGQPIVSQRWLLTVDPETGVVKDSEACVLFVDF